MAANLWLAFLAASTAFAVSPGTGAALSMGNSLRYTATGHPCAASPAGNTCWCPRLALPLWAAARVFPVILIGCHRERHAVYSKKTDEKWRVHPSGRGIGD
jgi:hypothetical protein